MPSGGQGRKYTQDTGGNRAQGSGKTAFRRGKRKKSRFHYILQRKAWEAGFFPVGRVFSAGGGAQAKNQEREAAKGFPFWK